MSSPPSLHHLRTACLTCLPDRVPLLAGDALFGMKAGDFFNLEDEKQEKLIASVKFKPFVMTVGIGTSNGKFMRCAWDVQTVPGCSPSFRASLGL